jgi:diguanylate cyclase (GGDEF)-like protein
MSIWQSLDPVLSVRLVLVALAVFLCLLAALTWERRHEAPEATSFALLLLCGALYTFAYSGEASATTMPHAVSWLNVEFLALPFIPPLWLLTAIRHNGERFSILAIFAIPVICFVAHFTNHWHGWFYLSVDFVRDGPFWELSFRRGPFALLENTYLLFSFVTAAWLYVTQMRSGSPLFRKQAMIMLASSVLPVTFYFLYLLGFSPWHLDITPFSFPLCAALYYYGAFSLGVFDLTPTARNLVFQGMRDAVLILDNRSRLLDFNAAATQLLPALDSRSVGQHVSTTLSNYPSLLSFLIGAHSGELQLGDVSQGDEELYLDVRAFPLRSGTRKLGHASILADITDQVQLREELRVHAETDALTGIANRRRFLDALDQEYDHALQLGRSLSLMLIDLDHFKSINDRFGHPTGDGVLFSAAGRLQSCLRAGDLLARFGGEEFSILLPSTDAEVALLCAERVLAAVSNHPISVDGYHLPLTVSIGLVTCNAQETDVREVTQLLKEADLALYRAKAEGRNRVIVAERTQGSAAEGPTDKPTEGSYGPDAPASFAVS